MSAVPTLAPVSAVVDLRHYAEGTTPSGDWIGGRAIPIFADEAAAVTALAPRGFGHVDGLTADEFVIVLAGRLEIESAAGPLQLEANQSGVLPVGVSFDWRAAENTLVIIVSVPATDHGDANGPARIDESAAMSPSNNPPLPELLIGPAPTCRNHSDYRSASGEFVCGTWDATPFHRRQIPFQQIELMHLLDGSVSFYDDKGRVTYEAGDVVLYVRGEGCAWYSDVHVKKVYATHRPAA